jgi:CelD/BcsL family acetyltransferase involved in cellulose biosynthesis
MSGIGRGKRTDPCRVECTEAAEPPPDAVALLDSAPDLFGTAPWWAVVLSAGLPDETRPVFLTVRLAGQPVAVLPMGRTGGKLHGLTTPYTSHFAPALAAQASAAAWQSLMRYCHRSPITRIDALDPHAPWLADLRVAARRARLLAVPFDHFGNWSEDVSGLTWAAYLDRRPGALRTTIRRRLKSAAAQADADYQLVTSPAQVDHAIEAYESVYRRSWKEPEPFPAFNPALIRAMAEAGWLRLGIWSIGGTPVAVQLWAVRQGHATVLKLAHDEVFKALSPGTVLTALILRHLLDQEHVARIDFGRGDDPYKQGWARERRQRTGLLLVNPLTPAGLAAAARHAAGRARHWWSRKAMDHGGPVSTQT